MYSPNGLLTGAEGDPTLTPEHADRLFLAGGDAHPQLTQDIADELGIQPGVVHAEYFASGEPHVRYGESVRGTHVIIVQPQIGGEDQEGTHRSPSDRYRITLEMIQAAVSASAEKVSVLVPFPVGSRQDRASQEREAVSIAVSLRGMRGEGASHFMAVDIHSQQSLPIFQGGTDHITAKYLLADRLASIMPGQAGKNLVLSPDSGRAKFSEDIADYMGIRPYIMSKRRGGSAGDPTYLQELQEVSRRVQGMHCHAPDDMFDTAGTIDALMKFIREAGALTINIAAPYGVFSGNAIELLAGSEANKVLVTDLVPTKRAEDELGDKVIVVPTARMLANAIKRATTRRGSVSSMYGDRGRSRM